MNPLSKVVSGETPGIICISNSCVRASYALLKYYRLIAPQLIEQTGKRLLYLDPDILVINPVRELFETSMQDKAFAAAMHKVTGEVTRPLNQVRLNSESDSYYNSGVLLMDVDRVRNCVDIKDLYTCVEQRDRALLLPDQDLFNALYHAQTVAVDDILWNYDARNFALYLARTKGEASMDWVVQNTAILHFCGRAKPWTERYRYRFGSLYKHYDHQASRFFDR